MRSVLRIEICGNIASGKTTLSNILKRLNFHAVHERFQSNPFWEKFYQDPTFFAFETEVSFLLQHYHDIKNAMQSYQKIACDNSLLLDLAYSDVTIKGTGEKNVFDSTIKEIVKQLGYPQLLIYLKCDPQIAFNRIIKRARAEEQGVGLGFLVDMERALENVLKKYTGDILVIESDVIDFAHNENDIVQVIELINAKLKSV